MVCSSHDGESEGDRCLLSLQLLTLPAMRKNPLRSWLNANGMLAADFARLGPFPESSVSQWLSGERAPDLTTAFRVEEVTAGAVKASDWAGRQDGRRRRRTTRAA